MGNAYMRFCKDHWFTIKEENPGISFGKTGQILGHMWWSLSEEEKDVCRRRSKCSNKIKVLTDFTLNELYHVGRCIVGQAEGVLEHLK